MKPLHVQYMDFEYIMSFAFCMQAHRIQATSLLILLWTNYSYYCFDCGLIVDFGF